MTYQVNFHSFLVSKHLEQSDTARLQSPELQVALHDAMMEAFHKLFPEMQDTVQCGMGRVEVMYLGL
jgi:hypothetical protein